MKAVWSIRRTSPRSLTIKKRLLFLVCSAVLTTLPHTASADLDIDKLYGYSDRYGELTPTQVYSLMENVDAIVMHYAYSYKKELGDALPRTVTLVEDRTPNQVFLALLQLSDKLNILADDYGVPRVQRIVREQAEAIPAEVFLLAGACLDTLAHILSVMQPENNFGDFYITHTYRQPKTPSDVYALVSLIDRKLIFLLGQQASP